MEKKMMMMMIPNPVSPFFSLVGFVGFLIFQRILNWAIRIHKFYSSSTQSGTLKNLNPERLNKQSKLHDDGKLCRGEVKMVMEKLGISCDPDGEKLQEKLGLEELLVMFEEKGPTSEEVKEAFEVFDENRDGYIDAEELQRVLCALGFVEGSESRDCKRMIGAFDTNGDGRIDFTEFVKFMEIISFC